MLVLVFATTFLLLVTVMLTPENGWLLEHLTTLPEITVLMLWLEIEVLPHLFTFAADVVPEIAITMANVNKQKIAYFL